MVAGIDPWLFEPDRIEFASGGLDCVMVRGPLDAWCGYFGVTREHPWYGKDYNAEVDGDVDMNTCIEDIGILNAFAMMRNRRKKGKAEIASLIPCHGGLTWSGPSHYIADSNEDIWWFGFDCGHSGDKIPGRRSQGRVFDINSAMFALGFPENGGGKYRDAGYVMESLKKAALFAARYRKKDAPTDDNH